MQTHEIDYKISGHDIQYVAMFYMEKDIDFQTKMGDGSDPNQGVFKKLMQAGGRMLTGESLFMTHFSHRGTGKGHVAFAAPYPGTIVPVSLGDLNGNLIAQRDAFLCAAMGTKLSVTMNKRLGSSLVGGEGFILQKITGEGMAFIHAGGTLVEKELHDETIRVDTGCVAAFEDSIDFSIEKAGNLKSMVFGGEGLFLATLKGTGKIWLQSMPIKKLMKELSPSSGNQKKGSRSILGNLLES